MPSLWRETCGGVAVYTAVFLAFAAGAGTLAVDFGRLVVLRGQMQDYADSAALAGAAQLDGRAGARERARRVITEAIAARSAIGGDGGDFALQAIDFYSALDPEAVAASDQDALFVEVTLEPRSVDLLLQPALDAVSGGTSATARNVAAAATAKPSPFICHAPPLMLCDLAEADPALDLMDPANAGRQVRLKEPQGGDGTIAPGNFGLLALPDGSSGANDIGDALAAVAPPDCYALDLTTATGSMTNQVRNGLNTRFFGPEPAPDVINFPRDDALTADADAKIGDGTWDREGYWLDKHGSALPAALDGATRYQAYLYELGLTFARNGARTVYPADGALPAGFTRVVPPGADVPVAADPADADDPDHDGEPDSAPAANGQARRLLEVPLLRCEAEGVHGHGTYPSEGRFVEMFVTETALQPPGAAIYGEVVRPLATTNDPDFHANVRLVR